MIPKTHDFYQMKSTFRYDRSSNFEVKQHEVFHFEG